MLSTIQIFYLVAIFISAVAGGFLPLTKPERVRESAGFPRGEAFASGVFLALSLLMMLPSAFSIFRQVLPAVEYPIASIIAVTAFLILLAIEHLTGQVVQVRENQLEASRVEPAPAIIPLLLTGMIAAPSFFLGVALGVSDGAQANLIFIAIILHKGTAGFALALNMVRSTLTHWQAVLLFLAFASMTPIGLLLGGVTRELQPEWLPMFKACVLALGAGTFLYMGTLHELKRAPMIQYCQNPRCFFIMVGGFAVTALVRWIMGEAHHM